MKALLTLSILLSSIFTAVASANVDEQDFYKGCTVKLSLAYSYGKSDLIRALNESGYIVKKFRRRDSRANRPFFELETDHVKKHSSMSYVTLSFRAVVDYSSYLTRPVYRYSILPGGDMISDVFNRKRLNKTEEAKIAFSLLEEAIKNMPICNKALVDHYQRIEDQGGYHPNLRN